MITFSIKMHATTSTDIAITFQIDHMSQSTHKRQATKQM